MIKFTKLMMIRILIKLLIFMKVMISKYFLNDNIFDKTIDFMKVMISKYFLNDNIFDKTIDFIKVW
jgi:hypothetical protein